jgi:hypothetical protein
MKFTEEMIEDIMSELNLDELVSERKIGLVGLDVTLDSEPNDAYFVVSVRDQSWIPLGRSKVAKSGEGDLEYAVRIALRLAEFDE